VGRGWKRPPKFCDGRIKKVGRKLNQRGEKPTLDLEWDGPKEEDKVPAHFPRAATS